MVVSSEDTNARSALPVPDADCLVVGSTQDPRIFMVEKGGTDVIQMSQQSEYATLLLIVPHLDLVIVASGHKKGLLVVEADSTYWTIVFIKLIQKCAHAVVPQLNYSVV